MRADFHTHILPGIDDGSRNIEESTEMLRELRKQGIDTVVATPHFYCEENTVETFLERRDAAFALLQRTIQDEPDMPAVLCGAEVLFYPEIFALENLDKLCIQGTRYIMIELPFQSWTKRIYESIFRISTHAGLKPIIAHVDRYLKLQKDKNCLEELLHAGAVLQVNAEAFEGLLNRRKVLNLIKTGKVSLLGSDCHNMRSRKPNIAAAYTAVAEKLGPDTVTGLEEISRKILQPK